MIRKFQNPWGTAQFLNRFQFKAFQIYLTFNIKIPMN